MAVAPPSNHVLEATGEAVRLVVTGDSFRLLRMIPEGLYYT
jgi:hypothetical protein